MEKVFEQGVRYQRDQHLALLAVGLVLIVYALSRLAALAFPLTDGRPSRVATNIAVASLAVACVCAIVFLWAGLDMQRTLSQPLNPFDAIGGR